MYANTTDYLADALLEHETGKTSYTKPSTWVLLSTAIPTNAGGNITELSGFARRATTGTDWATAAARAIASAVDMEFGPAGAAGTIVAWGLIDADTSGNLLRWGLLGKVYTALAEELTSSDATISLTDASSLPASGTIIIGDEIITYTGKSTNDLTGCTRGTGGSTAHAHASGSDVFSYLPRTVANGDTLKFSSGDLVLKYKA